jgi:hypothetical protein
MMLFLAVFGGIFQSSTVYVKMGKITTDSFARGFKTGSFYLTGN